jgi:hypothetical protein
MPVQKTIHRAQADKRAGKAASTQAGEFVKEEVDRVRAGKHGVRSARQAIAIGLSKARRAGVDLKAPKKGTTSEATRKKAAKDSAAGQHKSAAKSTSTESKTKRARAATTALKRESGQGASSAALSRQTKTAAARGRPASRSAAAKKAASTKGAAGRSAAAKKAAHTRAARSHH